jgi:hypothetical protein
MSPDRRIIRRHGPPGIPLQPLAEQRSRISRALLATAQNGKESTRENCRHSAQSNSRRKNFIHDSTFRIGRSTFNHLLPVREGGDIPAQAVPPPAPSMHDFFSFYVLPKQYLGRIQKS